MKKISFKTLAILAGLIGLPSIAMIAYSATREGPVDTYSSTRPSHFLKGIYVGDVSKQVLLDKRNKVTGIYSGRAEIIFPAGSWDGGFNCLSSPYLAWVPGAAVGDQCLVAKDRGPDIIGAGAATTDSNHVYRCDVTDAGVVTMSKCSTSALAVGDAGYRITVISNQ